MSKEEMIPTEDEVTSAADRIEELERENNRLKQAMNKYSEDEMLCSLQADNARLRDLLAWVDKYVGCAISGSIKEALAATPEQSLARLRNQVREECAMLADDLVLYTGGDCAEAIRAMKEPE